MRIDEIRNILPEASLDKFDDITQVRVLGASKHIGLIYKIVIDILNTNETLEVKLKKVDRVIEFFIITRGKSSVAITNQLNSLRKRIHDCKAKTSESIKEIVENESLNLEIDINKIVKYALNIADKMKRILVYDYSSTVEEFLKKLPTDVEVVVPESRSLNGGAPFVKSLIETNHKVRFVVDASLYSEVRNCDAVFIGAETYCFDGSTYNTIGSEMLAFICAKMQIPYYVLTPTNKVYIDSLFGKTRQIIKKDLRHKFEYLFDESIKDKIDFENVELVQIRGDYITLYITEFGVCNPYDLRGFLKENCPNYFV